MPGPCGAAAPSPDPTRAGQGHRRRLLRAHLRWLLLSAGRQHGIGRRRRGPPARAFAPPQRPGSTRGGSATTWTSRVLCATGKPYAALPAAFTHRNSYKAACSCTGKGFGLATDYSARYDQTLRVGDAVMTAKGMMVFNGGAKVPYRDASFTPSIAATASTRPRARRCAAWSRPRFPTHRGWRPCRWPPDLRRSRSLRPARQATSRSRSATSPRGSAAARRPQGGARAALSGSRTDWALQFRSLLNICFYCVFYLTSTALAGH